MLNHSLCYTCESSKHLFYFSDCLPKSCLWDKSLQSCPTLCDPMDCSLPCSSVYGILQPGIRSGLPFPPPGIFLPQGLNSCFFGLRQWQVNSLALAPLGKLPMTTKLKLCCFQRRNKFHICRYEHIKC